MAWPIEAYLDERSLELAPRTIDAYRSILRDAERRTACGISTLTSRRLLELAASWRWRDQSLSALRGFLKWLGHPLAEAIPPGIPTDAHRRLTWYTVAELEEIVRACESPRQRLIVHLAAELMLRRVEIERLRWEDLEPTSIRILGKGRHGGKVRRIPWHPYTRNILRAFTAGVTSMEVSPSARGSADPARKSTAVLGLRRSALDKELKRIQETLRWEGVTVNLQFHDLRRSGARLYMETGVRIGKGPLEVLNELRGILGHEDLRTTMVYVGWDLEASGATLAAMPRLDNRMEAAPEAEGGMDRVGFATTRTRTAPRTPPTS